MGNSVGGSQGIKVEQVFICLKQLSAYENWRSEVWDGLSSAALLQLVLGDDRFMYIKIKEIQ